MSSEPQLPAVSGPTGAVTAADLISVVEAVPGVRGIEAGIATTLRSLDARLRRQHTDHVRFGMVIDPVTGQVVVEIALTVLRPVWQIVAEVQGAVQAALQDAGTGREVLVRVQSLS
ncbi:hypothetical protein [Citricoccus sp.]|uniref:hypothetical protein n=1 Tax=Citricoccus sp. TaxID=1978372 RepID=UPI0028BF4023|nr:hypothetical protein [Citricoccus sp.]